MIAIFISILYYVWVNHYRLVISATPSVPGLVFLICLHDEYHEYQVDDLIYFKPPRSANSNLKFIKFIRGRAGDKLSISNDHFYINGVDQGQILKTGTSNRVLTPNTQQEIPSFHFAVIGTHPRSFDSRYKEIGLINRIDILGSAHKLF